MAFSVELKATVPQLADFGRTEPNSGIFKAYIPNFLYKPPYGYPTNKNVDLIKKLSHNAYIFSIKTAIKDRIASTNWDIRIKEEFMTSDTGEPVDTSVFEKKKKEVIAWFENPNRNKESFEHLLRKLVDSILEMDAGVFVKVFNRAGEFKELFSYDGATFLKNPDIHGYIGDRDDFVFPADSYFGQADTSGNAEQGMESERVLKLYDNVYRSNAAYFQYGWTAGSMPVPFGKREVIYMMRHPRSDSIYGTGPVEVLSDIILTLVYGSNYNLDFFVNNNMPDGIIQLLDANEQQIRAFRQRFEAEFKAKDAYNNYRRKFHSYPVVSKEAKFTQFQLTAEQMQIIEQQKWFIKLVWACFGITPSELGFTEDSNKATEIVQSNTGKKKLINPLLKLIEYHLNMEVMVEFDAPFLEFVWDDYDLEEDIKKHTLYESQIRMGIKTPEMVAEELGIDVARLKKEKDEAVMRQQLLYGGFGGGNSYGSESEENPSKNEDEEEGAESREDADKQERELKAFDRANGVNTQRLPVLGEELPPLEKALKDHFREVEKRVLAMVEELEKDELSKIRIRTQLKALPEDLLSRITDVFKVEQFAPLVSSTIKKNFMKGLEDIERQANKNFIPNKRAIDFLSEQTFKNIKGMSEEIGQKLRKDLVQGILNRESITQIKARIKKSFDIADNRAEMIARTETNRALNQGRLDTARQSGLFTRKKWSAHLDSRTSPVCKALDGKIVGIDEKFEYGGEVFDACPAHVNCRSRVIYLQEGDE